MNSVNWQGWGCIAFGALQMVFPAHGQTLSSGDRDLGGLTGLNYFEATRVSVDGSIVAGNASDAEGAGSVLSAGRRLLAGKVSSNG